MATDQPNLGEALQQYQAKLDDLRHGLICSDPKLFRPDDIPSLPLVEFAIAILQRETQGQGTSINLKAIAAVSHLFASPVAHGGTSTGSSKWQSSPLSQRLGDSQGTTSSSATAVVRGPSKRPIELMAATAREAAGKVREALHEGAPSSSSPVDQAARQLQFQEDSARLAEILTAMRDTLLTHEQRHNPYEKPTYLAALAKHAELLATHDRAKQAGEPAEQLLRLAHAAHHGRPKPPLTSATLVRAIGALRHLANREPPLEADVEAITAVLSANTGLDHYGDSRAAQQTAQAAHQVISVF